MSSKIFRSIWAAALTVLLLTLVLVFSMLYKYYDRTQQAQLTNEVHLASRGVTLNGEKYLKNLDTDNFRVTWIAADGKVKYDNKANPAKMSNHKNRKEVKEAMSKGFGASSRYSDTLSIKQLYAAERLPDGTVLRLSVNQAPIWMMLLGFAQPIAVVIILAILLSFWLASRLSKRIVAPINKLDLDNPMEYIDNEDFKELAPLLQRMNIQNGQIQKDKSELEKTSLIRQEFTANASHELKTPLHAISGYAELLENGIVRPEDVKPFAGKIRAESLRMTRLVDDIIDLSKLDEGGESMKWEEVDLYRIADNAMDSLQSAAQEADVQMSLEGESAWLHGIAQVLYGIVYNLCDNAIKYNHPGGYVHVNVRPSDKHVILTVTDNGIGIPLEDQERIFERFYRVDKSRSKEVGGTGLGLSIVKHAMMIHKATVKLDSTPGQGSAFTITFPEDPEAEK